MKRMAKDRLHKLLSSPHDSRQVKPIMLSFTTTHSLLTVNKVHKYESILFINCNEN